MSKPITLTHQPRVRQGDPDGQNRERAQWALEALQEFQLVTRADNEDALSDLLCDLMHLADYAKKTSGLESFPDALARAQRHYAAETEEVAQ